VFHTLKILAAMALLGWAAVLGAAEPLFPFVISYDAPGGATDVSAWLDRPAGKHGFVRNRDGRLATDAGAIRFWGTNLVFDACFPTHDEAERLSARLARLGINCARLHHMDARPIWGHSPNKLTIDPRQLERLDYLVYQLKLHGIYIDMNLHVSRWFDKAEGFVAQAERPQFDKGLDNFEPRMIELQEKYARDLLCHVNPYLKTAYVSEPAVALVEINNENALYAIWGSGQLDRLPEPYMTTFRKQWNGWLRRKYGDTGKLRAAWSAGTTTTGGGEMLRNGNFAAPWQKDWRVERDEQTGADVSVAPIEGEEGHHMLRLAVSRIGNVPWHPQLTQGGFQLKKGATYTLSFRLRSTATEECEAVCQMAHEPWERLGLAAKMEPGSSWRSYRFTFIAPADDQSARIAFAQLHPATYDLADVSLRPGGVVGLEPGEQLEDDGIATLRPSLSVSPASNDFCDFLWNTERRYWHGMYRFLKDELHVRSLISGTQLGYSPIYVQAGLDYIDSHAYWQHPAFPNRAWNMKDWYINDVAMAAQPPGVLGRLASFRVAGKPYTVSEYNHPVPNSYCGEGFPMIASFGAFQRWDGIFSFAYSHNRQFEPRRIEGFFDIKSNPAVLAHAPACAAMFLRGDVAPSSQPATFPFSHVEERRQLYAAHAAGSLTANDLHRDPRLTLVHGTALDLSAPDSADPRSRPAAKYRPKSILGRTVSDTGEICWDVSQSDAGYFTVNSRGSKLFTGFVRGRTFRLGNVTLRIGPTRLDWATVSFVSLDDEKFFDGPERILIAATGVVQNRDTKLERLGGPRVTLHNRWGSEPVLCEGIPAAVTLAVPAERVRCYPLDEAGHRRGAITVGGSGKAAEIKLDPRYKTLWYEVEIRSPGA
jgi:hypothetical protein